jgi:hypothetical protein
VSLQNYTLSKLLRSLSAADSTAASADEFSEQRHRLLLLLEDGAIIAQYRLLHKLVHDMFPVAKQAVVLLKVWMTQVSMRFGADCLDGHAVSLLVSYLLYARVGELKSVANLQASNTKQGSSSSSAHDATSVNAAVFIFQNVLEYLAGLSSDETTVLDFSNQQPTAQSTVQSITGCGSLSLPALCSGTNAALALLHPLTGKQTGKQPDTINYNSLWRVSTSSFEQLRSEASRCLQVLKMDNEFAFRRIFLEKHSFYQKYDLYLSFQLPVGGAGQQSVLPTACISDYVGAMCRCALGSGNAKADRIRSSGIVVSSAAASETGAESAQSSMSAHSSATDKAGRVQVHIGLILNPENILRKVDRGPTATAQQAANSQDVSAFQQFWGSKCQLRRFQDGSIVEAVVWDDVNASASSEGNGHRVGSKRKLSASAVESIHDSIPERILKYILRLHGSSLVHGGHVTVKTAPGSKLDSLLPECPRHAEADEQTGEEADGADVDPRLVVGAAGSSSSSSKKVNADALCRRSIEALDQLRDILASKLNGLPLGIASVSAASPELRYTALYPPIPHPFVESTSSSSGDGGMRAVSGHNVSLCVQTLRVFATLDSSGKWQLDKEARDKSITAFHFRIAELIADQFKVFTCMGRCWRCVHPVTRYIVLVLSD